LKDIKKTWRILTALNFRIIISISEIAKPLWVWTKQVWTLFRKNRVECIVLKWVKNLKMRTQLTKPFWNPKLLAPAHQLKEIKPEDLLAWKLNKLIETCTRATWLIWLQIIIQSVIHSGARIEHLTNFSRTHKCWTSRCGKWE